MQNYDNLEKAINDKDVKSVRNLLGTIVYACRDFSDGEFDRMTRYAEKELKNRGIILKEDPKGIIATLNKEKEELTDNDFSDSVFELKENFCDDRINEIKRIGKILYGSGQVDGISPNLSSHHQKKIVLKVLLVIGILLLMALIASQAKMWIK